MLAAWIDGDARVLPTAEIADEPQDSRPAPEQTCLHLFTSVDAGSGTPPSREYGAPVCITTQGAGTGLERIPDPHTRPRLGQDRHRDGRAGGLQDLGGGCFD